MIAGKIVPAIATTTCMITGLASLEMYKVLKGGTADNTLNSFVNLAVNVYSMANPQPPKKNVSRVRLSAQLVFCRRVDDLKLRAVRRISTRCHAGP